VLLLFLVTLINLIDRSTISVLAPVITSQLRLNNLQFATMNTWFLVAYAASQALSGRFFDRVGTRRGLGLSVLVWSVAAMAHASARGFASLVFCRFALGIGEGGNWPAAAKLIAEWFPARERALGMSIVNAASALGLIVAPPLVVLLQSQFGWRAAFLVTGALGLAWLGLWLLFYHAPGRNGFSSAEECAQIGEDRDSSTASQRPGWSELLRCRQVWAIVLARFFADPVWWLYLIWLPLYLHNTRGFNLQQIGLSAWLPYVVAAAGSLTGGWASGYCIARNWSVDRARKTVIVAATFLMLANIFAATARGPLAALAFIGLVLFGFQSWIGNVQTLPSDFFSSHVVASVAGLGGLGAAVGSILLNQATGFVVDRFHSYTPILVAASVLPLLATIVLLVLGGPIRRVEISKEVNNRG
jgi:ACS family hexuronate transporter-like MFS transporter